MALNTKSKVRGIAADAGHPAEIADFLVRNADKIKAGVLVLDFVDDDGKTRSLERYFGSWGNSDLAWWVACLQATLTRNLNDA